MVWICKKKKKKKKKLPGLIEEKKPIITSSGKQSMGCLINQEKHHAQNA